MWYCFFFHILQNEIWDLTLLGVNGLIIYQLAEGFNNSWLFTLAWPWCQTPTMPKLQQVVSIQGPLNPEFWMSSPAQAAGSAALALN